MADRWPHLGPKMNELERTLRDMGHPVSGNMGFAEFANFVRGIAGPIEPNLAVEHFAAEALRLLSLK